MTDRASYNLLKPETVRRNARKLAKDKGHDLTKFVDAPAVPGKQKAYCPYCHAWTFVQGDRIWGSATTQECPK